MKERGGREGGRLKKETNRYKNEMNSNYMERLVR